MCKLNMFHLEKRIYPVEQWVDISHNYPEWIQEQMVLPPEVPIGFGWDEETGWFAIESSGQGPYLVWVENV